ncbi:hypothetical protein ACQP2T_48365 [Nonomuraea sp. CA-143628]|uniref:hypothetical protein n=1 Tax=Nonomuraea sp. CA-143628 TaxID=3239997 RepID=UPI003D8C8596
MTRLVQNARAALAMALLACLILSHGLPSASERHVLPAVAAGAEHYEGSAQPGEASDHVWARDRQQTVAVPRAKTPFDTVVASSATQPPIIAASGVEGPPYGLRRQRGAALPAVLQVFRC